MTVKPGTSTIRQLSGDQLLPPFCDLIDVKSLRTHYTKKVMELVSQRADDGVQREGVYVFGLLWMEYTLSFFFKNLVHDGSSKCEIYY